MNHAIVEWRLAVSVLRWPLRTFLPVLSIMLVGTLPATAQLQEIWRRTSDPFTLFSALTLGGQTNVFVVGNDSRDFVTSKFSPEGVAAWGRRTSFAYEEPNAIAADENGNVWVSGGTSTNENLSVLNPFTVKYSASGEIVWSNRFTEFQVGTPIYLAVDRFGN